MLSSKSGYYDVAGKLFRQKIPALLYAQESNNPVRWHFHDAAMAVHQWNIEPEASLQELYYRRARQLREKYDYLIVQFSGGADSNNVVRSFLDQGLFIDEIVSNWNQRAIHTYKPADVTSTGNNNMEYELNAKFRIEEISRESPKTKITITDTAESFLAKLKKIDPDWALTKNNAMNPTSEINHDILRSSATRTLDTKRNICVIAGVEKPRLTIVDGKLYIMFVDKAANISAVGDYLSDYDNVETVLFYWDPECVEMMSKQAHTVLKFLNTNPQLQGIWEEKNPKGLEQRRIYGEPILRSVLYSNWNNKWFQVQKSTGDWFSTIDEWFFNTMQGTEELQNWLNGLKNLAPKISKFLEIKDEKIVGVRAFATQKYYIGPIGLK